MIAMKVKANLCKRLCPQNTFKKYKEIPDLKNNRFPHQIFSASLIIFHPFNICRSPLNLIS